MLGVGKRLSGDIARIADLTWSKGYSILYNVIHSYKNWGRRRRVGVCFPRWLFVWALICLWEVVNDFLCIISLFFTSLFHCWLNCLYFSPWVFLLLFFLLPPPTCWGGQGNERAAIWVLGCWLGSAHHIDKLILSTLKLHPCCSLESLQLSSYPR